VVVVAVGGGDLVVSLVDITVVFTGGVSSPIPLAVVGMDSNSTILVSPTGGFDVTSSTGGVSSISWSTIDDVAVVVVDVAVIVVGVSLTMVAEGISNGADASILLTVVVGGGVDTATASSVATPSSSFSILLFGDGGGGGGGGNDDDDNDDGLAVGIFSSVVTI